MLRLRLVLLSLLVVCAGCAFAASSASALRWFYCANVGSGGLYTESLCVTHEPSHNGKWELKELQGLLLISQRVVPGTESTLTGEILTSKTEIGCTAIDAIQASILNPVSLSENGDDSGTELFLGCTVKKPAGLRCTIKEGDISMPTLSHLLTILGDNWDVFKPQTGNILSTYAFEKCTLSTLNKTYTIEGEFAGLWDNATSTILFGTNHTQELLQNLTFASHPAHFNAQVLVLTHAGGGVQVL